MLEQAAQVTPLPYYLRLTHQPLPPLQLSRPLVYWHTEGAHRVGGTTRRQVGAARATRSPESGGAFTQYPLVRCP